MFANDSGADSYTALRSAAQYGLVDLSPNVMDLLLSARADIDAPTAEGFLPLHLAAYHTGIAMA